MGLRRFFLKFVGYVIVSLAAVFAFWVFLLFALVEAGAFLPANRVEKEVTKWQDTLDAHSNIVPSDIPEGADYTFFSHDGALLATSLNDRALAAAEQLAASDDAGQMQQGLLGSQVHLKIQTDAQIVIITYPLRASFANPVLARMFPSMELFGLIVLFMLVAADLILFSFHFARRLTRELLPLQAAAEQIRAQNLDFTCVKPHLKEFRRVSDSLEALRSELKRSLTKQWNLEQIQKRQISALAHDIKTPLTILKGNAELLAESSLDDEQSTYTRFILENAGQIETYALRMIEVTKNPAAMASSCVCSLSPLLASVKEHAGQLCAGAGLTLAFCLEAVPNTVPISEDSLRRAVYNLLDNAVQYSPAGGMVTVAAFSGQGYCSKNAGTSELTDGIVTAAVCSKPNGFPKNAGTLELTDGMGIPDLSDLPGLPDFPGDCFILTVSDEGCGFSGEALRLAGTEFYRADKSRGSHTHFGLGLSITKQLVTDAGGGLFLMNRDKGGAIAGIYLPAALSKHAP